MSNQNTRPPVVVGATRSEAGRRAVAWAAEEAARRHLPLHMVHVQEWPPGAAPKPGTAHSSQLWSAHFRAAGQTVLETDRMVALERHPDLEVDVMLAEGRPVEVLREAAENAAMLVLGAHRASELQEAFSFGGIGASLVGHPPCPVVLALETEPGEDEHGPVVVGVDGSAASEPAVAFALEEAALHGTDVLAVEVRRARRGEGEENIQESLLDLSEALAGWREKYPEVSVQHQVLTGNPAMMLAKAARGARCLVVGSRGLGGFRGLILGSTSRTLVHHAPCPLVVVPPTASLH